MVFAEIQGLSAFRMGLRQFKFSMPKVQQSFLATIGNLGVELFRANTPVATGNLKGSWAVLSTTKSEVNIGIIGDIEFEKLNFIRFGTPPHEISAREGGPSEVMRFSRGGAEIFSTTVFHPGTRANDFVDRLGRLMDAEISSTLDAAFVLHSGLYKEARKSGAISSTGTFRKLKSGNATRTVGLSEFSGARRNFGRSTLVRTRTGRISNRRRLSRRRRRGASINSKKVLASLKM